MFEMPTESGSSLTRQQVLFSWALAESFSPRWKDILRQGMNEELKRKNDAKEIRDYSQEEQELLIHLLFAQEGRGGYLPDYIDPATEFRIIEIPAEALEWIAVLPSFSFKRYPVPLGHFVEWGYDPAWSDDPRVVADHFLKNPPPQIYTGYPLIGYCQELQSDVLVEGYARCITALRHHRAGENIAPMRMIYCSVPQEKRMRADYTPD